MYGIPLHIVAVIQYFYTDFSCSVGGSDLTFLVKSSGVRQECSMCGLLFKIVGFYAEHQREGNDIVLLSHLSSDTQDKTEFDFL